MNKDEEIIESLVAGGVIGASLGLLIAENKKEGLILGAIAGAAILATLRASQQARKTNVPIWVEEGGNLYEIIPNEGKRFVREIVKPKGIQPHFKLE